MSFSASRKVVAWISTTCCSSGVGSKKVAIHSERCEQLNLSCFSNGVKKSEPNVKGRPFAYLLAYYGADTKRSS
jgi:hypothetical protein